jgi:hypothetical protein
MARRKIPKFIEVLLQWILAVLLIPVVLAAFHQLVLMGPALDQEGWRSWWVYALGMAAYIVLERIFNRPMWLYVFGHELTHAISGLLTGARIYQFKASSKGGEVRLSKSNAFVAISPYIIPLYLIVVVALYAIIKNWYSSQWLDMGFQFLLGATLAFHISLTAHAVHRHQSDLKVMGMFLSVVIITLGNALIMGILGVSLFKKTPTLKEYALGLKDDTVKISRVVVEDFVPRAASRVKEFYGSLNS